MEAFKIAPGLFTIPNIGFVDSRKEVSNEKAFAIYKLPRRVFPKITLGPEAKTFLKKQKLDAKEFARLFQNAVSVEEVELLKSICDYKTALSIADTKLQALANQTKD